MYHHHHHLSAPTNTINNSFFSIIPRAGHFHLFNIINLTCFLMYATLKSWEGLGIRLTKELGMRLTKELGQGWITFLMLKALCHDISGDCY